MININYDAFRSLLSSELILAEGCTEPIAIAYAAAKARDVLGVFPDFIELSCSGNVIKNVMGVFIPNAGGRRGVVVAAILGTLVGNSDLKLQVLENVNNELSSQIDPLLSNDFCRCSVADSACGLFISVTAHSGIHSANVVIESTHTNITQITYDGKLIQSGDSLKKSASDASFLTINDIFSYAETEEISQLKGLFSQQIECNMNISSAGLHAEYGAQVGKTIYNSKVKSPETIACASAAAAVDARMGGCPLPVVINSGSGDQGITVSVPVIVFSKESGITDEKMLRALAISNLVNIHQKRKLGSLSAFCGTVCAAAGAGAAITWLRGGSRKTMEQTITNTLGMVSGMVCDGAKPSCAGKVATALQTAFLASDMAMQNCAFQPGEGLIFNDTEKTITAVTSLGRDGMKEADRTILNLMLSHSA